MSSAPRGSRARGYGDQRAQDQDGVRTLQHRESVGSARSRAENRTGEEGSLDAYGARCCSRAGRSVIDIAAKLGGKKLGEERSGLGPAPAPIFAFSVKVSDTD